MASKNVTSAASSQYMLEVHMSTIYHKGGISLAQPSPLYSVRNEIVLAPKKAMAPFRYFNTVLLFTGRWMMICTESENYCHVKLK